METFKKTRAWKTLVMTLGLPGLLLASGVVLADSENDKWQHFGQSVNNDRHAAKEKIIGRDNVAELEVLWETNIRELGGGGVWQTAAVDGKAVYFPDSAGYLYALNRKTGELLWQRSIAEYSSKQIPPFLPQNFSRTTPAVKGNTVIIGDQANRFPFYNNFDINQAIGAEVMAVDKNTGDPLWTTIADLLHTARGGQREKQEEWTSRGGCRTEERHLLGFRRRHG